MEKDLENNLHYSSICCISDADVVKIKTFLIEQLKANKEIIRESKEEGPHVFSFDFFRLL